MREREIQKFDKFFEFYRQKKKKKLNKNMTLSYFFAMV